MGVKSIVPEVMLVVATTVSDITLVVTCAHKIVTTLMFSSGARSLTRQAMALSGPRACAPHVWPRPTGAAATSLSAGVVAPAPH